MKKAEMALRSMLTRPKSVAIVALGRSMETFVREQMTTQHMCKSYDEVWVVNRGLAATGHDKVFALDDLRWLNKRDKYYGKKLREHKKPIVTSTVYPEYPTSVAYPYQEVLEFIQDDIFNVNTVSYMLAYALFIGCKSISIFGADFAYPNGNFAESGGQAVAYLCGFAKKMTPEPVSIVIPTNSTLLYAHKVVRTPQGHYRPPYGYHRKEEMKEGNNEDGV